MEANCGISEEAKHFLGEGTLQMFEERSDSRQAKRSPAGLVFDLSYLSRALFSCLENEGISIACMCFRKILLTFPASDILKCN
jgi:hypothetical protein